MKLEGSLSCSQKLAIGLYVLCQPNI